MPQDPKSLGWTLVQPAPPAASGWTLIHPANQVNIGANASFTANGQPVGPSEVQKAFPGSDIESHAKAFLGDMVMGALKRGGDIAVNLGETLHKIPGFSKAVDTIYGEPGLSQQAFGEAHQFLAPVNTAQKIGGALTDTAGFMLPSMTVGNAVKTFASAYPTAVRLLAQTASQAAVGAGVSSAEGGSPVTGAVLGASGPLVGGAAEGVAGYIGSKAVPLVRAGLKPTVTLLKSQPGASLEGIDKIANRMSQFIVDRDIASPTQAEAIIKNAEVKIKALMQGNTTPTDAPTRAMRYLDAIEKSASRQGLPETDVAAIRSAGAEMIRNDLGEDVVKTVMVPSPSGLVDAAGKPVMVPSQETTRALRTTMPADEALDMARATGKWANKKAYGELKGASTEASKAIERAGRDATKAAVPEIVPLLQEQAQAIPVKEALSRQVQREANRDVLSLPGTVAAASEMAAGKLPVIGMISQWLRNNQMKAGRWAGALQRSIDSGNVPEALGIMEKIGAGAGIAATGPTK